MTNWTDIFSEGLFKMAQRTFGEDSLKEAQNCLLDYLGVTMAGAQEAKDKTVKLIENLDGSGNYPVIGLHYRSSLNTSILVNGIHAHIIELDDGHRTAMMHPGAPIFSALIPVAIKYHISGMAFLKATITGYEAAIRLASCLQPSLKLKGYHGTGIAGSIGAAIAVATALGFDLEQTKGTIGAAITSASGILKVIKDVSSLKPFNVGNAALSGYHAAMVAQAGFQGPYDTFGGKSGYLSMMSDSPKTEFLDIKPSDNPSIHGIYRKPFAACRHCHSPIEAALTLRTKHQIDYRQIRFIDIQTYSLAVDGHEHTEISSINAAKMSTPYSVAAALIQGKADIDSFNGSSIQDEDTLDLTKRVQVSSDEYLSGLVPEKRAATVTLHMYDGQSYKESVFYPKGEPENPISESELESKFRSLAFYAGKSDTEMNRIVQLTHNLAKDFQNLIQYL